MRCARAFAEHHVTYLKGDWTRQDPQITAFLRENGRDGVPLYVYYPSHGPPEVLPQILDREHRAGRTEPGLVAQARLYDQAPSYQN